MRTSHTATELSGPVTDSAGVAETVSRVLAGDTDAFRLLVEAYTRAVYGLCRRLLRGNTADAEEVTQDTFLNAYRYLSRLEDRERFQPWLFQIARSLCRDRRRRQEAEQRALARRSELLRRQELLAKSSNDESPLTAALSDLPAEERQVLHLRYFEGRSYEELSRSLSLSMSQVDHLIRKARARLARRVAVRQQSELRPSWPTCRRVVQPSGETER